MSTNELKPLLNAKQAAFLLQAAVPSIYRWAESGRLPSVKVGRLLRFRRADLERWLEAGRTTYPNQEQER